MRRSVLSTILLAALLLPQVAEARTQYEIEHKNPVAPAPQIPGHTQIPADFWSGQHPLLVGRITPGTVLTGILEDTVSSNKSKAGDVFAFTLTDGLVKGETQVLPQGSRIVGVVTQAVPAARMRTGHAGQVQVSLQSIVFPDGAHIPFYGFIDINPAHQLQNAPQKRYAGSDLRDYSSRVTGMLGSFSSGLGTTMARRNRGNEFVMEKGELVPIRVNRTVTVPENQITKVIQPPVVPLNVPRGKPNVAPGLLAPQAPPMKAVAPGAVAPTAEGLVDKSNDVFNQPLERPDSPAFSPVNSMPDPF